MHPAGVVGLAIISPKAHLQRFIVDEDIDRIFQTDEEDLHHLKGGRRARSSLRFVGVEVGESSSAARVGMVTSSEAAVGWMVGEGRLAEVSPGVAAGAILVVTIEQSLSKVITKIELAVKWVKCRAMSKSS